MNLRRHRNRFRRVLVLLAVLALLPFMLRWFEHSQVYFPTRGLAATGHELGRPVEDVAFRASDGVRLHGWFFPADGTSPRADWVFLVCHGNGGNISHRLDLYAALLQTGAAVFAFDYRGYGRSGGRPGEAGTYLDAQAAHAWLRQKGFGAERILGFGESLGGAVIAELALRETLAGIVLQSTFTSIPDIGAELFPWLPVRWITTIKYDTLAKLPRVQVPVLVMHSREDRLVRFRHGERNFAAANEPKLMCELRGDHNDPMADTREFAEGLEKFLKLTIQSAAVRGEVGPRRE